ncbi:hypothetical protein EI94DRAFT_1813487 [Lactarius quietus]|nr:hypothetical protein EI94DRAFT_1813487 [Lactarius quietus]
MSSKNVLGPGAEGPPANLRTTRFITKAGTQPNVSPQVATQEKKKAKAKEAEEVELKALKVLIGKKCLSEDTLISHQTLLWALVIIMQKYSPSTPLPLARAMTAFAALMNEAKNAISQIVPNIEVLTQKALTNMVPQAKQQVPQQIRMPAAMPTEDTRYMISLGIDKKAGQVLLDNAKGEENYLNIYKIKEKAAKALGKITPPPTEHGDPGAKWLCIPENETAFTRKFDLDTIIRD